MPTKATVLTESSSIQLFFMPINAAWGTPELAFLISFIL